MKLAKLLLLLALLSFLIPTSAEARFRRFHRPHIHHFYRHHFHHHLLGVGLWGPWHTSTVFYTGGNSHKTPNLYTKPVSSEGVVTNPK